MVKIATTCMISEYDVEANLKADIYKHRTADFLGFTTSQGRRPEMYSHIMEEF